MTDHEQVKAALEAATTGHWWSATIAGVEEHVVFYGPKMADYLCTQVASIADAHLIANAPTWVAELLDENERRTQELDTLRFWSEGATNEVSLAIRQRDQARADLAAANARLAKVRELADEWEATQYRLPPGYPMPLSQFILIHFKQPLRAALDSKGGES